MAVWCQSNTTDHFQIEKGKLTTLWRDQAVELWAVLTITNTGSTELPGSQSDPASLFMKYSSKKKKMLH